MKKFILGYLLPRIGQFFMVIFIGVTIVYIIPRLSPSDPIEGQISRMMQGGVNFDKEMVEQFRKSLSVMYGLEGTPMEQYFRFWGQLIRGDLGISLSAFPTPVIDMIRLAMPWTIGLLLSATIISWILGNLFGAYSSYFPNSKFLNVFDVLTQAVRPIPYYILAMLLILLFAWVWPIFPISGAYPMGMIPNWSWQFFWIVLHHSVLPAFSLVLGGIGSWFVGMKSLTSNMISEDYVVYAETAGLKKNKILYSYIIRNALLPQITGLALSLGTIFSGSLILEVIFQYPGLGMLAYRAILQVDYTLIMGISILSIVGIAAASLLLDLVYPLFDPRVRHQ
ncbi:MAG: ABC transporter permease [Spirochaetaceae bacterium]|jgi:peptide/nickel transport system permease protein|nr:ABC transporter permease [Spirochaetaceae bacterium]